jgi:cell division protein FtsI/penicillin-binding protein 2
MRATPLQVATAYATLLNGGYLVKPTIIAKIYDQELQEEKINPVNIVRRVFKESTALELQEALYDVIHLNKDNKENISVE